MTVTLPAGFKHFPVSKHTILATMALPLAAALTSTKYLFYYAYTPFLSEYGQLWRLLTFQLAFVNESEVFLAIILLYQFRYLERLYSPHKYCSVIVVAYLYTLLIVSVLASIKFYTGLTWFNGVAAGPVSILFSLLAQFREHIPVMYKFEIVGPGQHKIVLTDQFFVFLISFQLAITQGWKSVSMALLGWIIGDLVSRSIIPGKQWRIPFWKTLEKTRSTTPALREDTPTLVANLRQEEEEEAATETRPLASQFLDTFRR